jgi:hypothetical protein
MDIKSLVKKWEEVINEGVKITDKKILQSTAVMLENEHNYLTGSLNETNATNTVIGYQNNYATNGAFHNIAVPMVRRTFPELVAHDLVGVQPLTQPVGVAFALRYRAGSTYNAAANVELGYNNIDSTFSQTTPSSAAEFLGSKAGTTGTVGSDFGIGIGTGSHISEVNMTLEKAMVEATTRKLRSRWSLEVAQDLKAMHGLDLEDEMMDVLSYEITAEIDRELLATIRTAAQNATYAVTTTVGTSTVNCSGHFNWATADGRWEAEKYRNLYNTVIRKANEIAISTRRGAGNWVVAHPTVCAMLEATSSFTIAPVSSDVNTAVSGVSRLGSLDGRITLYRDTFAVNEDFIVGYKGPSNFDAGVIYCPFIQLMANRAVFQDSFNPTIGLLSRYAIHANIMGSTVAGTYPAGVYYRYVIVTNFSQGA